MVGPASPRNQTMETQDCHPAVESSKRKSWSRQEVAEALSTFASMSSALGMSQHEYARRTGLPRSTLQWWLERQASIDAPPATIPRYASSGSSLRRGSSCSRSMPGSVADTWTAAMAEATDDLRVEIVQSTGDEALALIKHAETDLDAHHSPDLFHVQHEVVKGIGPAMARRVRAAQKVVEAKQERTARFEGIAKIHASSSEHGCCPPAYVEQRIVEAKADEAAAGKALAEIDGQREQMRKAIRDISGCYHPYDLERGTPRSAELVSKELDEHFATIDALADEGCLSERCLFSKALTVLEMFCLD